MSPSSPPDPQDWRERIAETIAAADAAAKAKDMAKAVELFDLCRTQLSTLTPQEELGRHVRANLGGARREALKIRAALLEKADPEAATRIAIFGDSLGLPRPEEMADFDKAISEAYSGRILERLKGVEMLGGVEVYSHCQRYFSTDDLVEMLHEQPGTLRDSHVLVHLGLNDCAVRMFMTDQRLALALLPQKTSAEILAFSRRHRHALVQAFPDFCYVPLPKFEENLRRIVEIAEEEKARSLTFCTMVVVPLKFWQGTPDICWNFTRYNLTVMTVAKEAGARMLDVDRIIWQHDNLQALNKDGMHLSPFGHELLASTWIKNMFGS